MSHQMQLYTYSPLPSKTCIRVLRRLPNPQHGALEFEFKIIDLRDLPQHPERNHGSKCIPTDQRYHCLSYTWGNPLSDHGISPEAFTQAEEFYSNKNLRDILCEGKILKVQPNLYEALLTLSSHSHFVDGDDNERNNERDPIVDQYRLFLFAMSGESKPILELLRRGANPNAIDYTGQTPTHHAARHGHYDSVRVLLKMGAMTNIRDDNHHTPHDLAVMAGHYEVANLLASYNTDGAATPRLVNATHSKIPGDALDGIWVDAICINQEDLDERQHQVQLMDWIYSTANYTVVWLGPSDEWTDLAVSALSKVGTVFSEFSSNSLDPFHLRLRRTESEVFPDLSEREWESLAAFYGRRWFSRIWVIQEVALSDKIFMLCGQRAVDWDHVRSASIAILAYKVVCMDNVCFKHLSRKPGFNSAVVLAWLQDEHTRLRSLRPADRPPTTTRIFSLPVLASFTCVFQASDPRDKCYALLPLSRLHYGTQVPLIPDYRKSAEETCIEFASQILKETKDLGTVLPAKFQTTLTPYLLPSWVAWFDHDRVGSCLCPDFNAAAGIPPAIRHIGNELHVQGIEIGTITHLANIYGEIDPNLLKALLPLKPYYNYHGTGQNLSEALWRTLCQNVDSRNCEGMVQAMYTLPLYEMPYQADVVRAPADFGPMFKLRLMTAICLALERHVDSGSQKLEDLPLGPLADVFLSLDTLHEGSVGDPLPTSEDVVEYFHSDAFQAPEDKFWPDLKTKIWPYQLTSCFVRPHSGQRFFSTSEGYIGTASDTVNIGDTVWVVGGSNMPLILRRQGQPDPLTAVEETDSGDAVDGFKFNFVSDAYVHGVMEGEVVAEMEAGKRQIQNLILV